MTTPEPTPPPSDVPDGLATEEREVLGLRVADCGCCYVVDQIGLTEWLAARDAEWAERVEALAAEWERWAQ
jgi:hypothetical protein